MPLIRRTPSAQILPPCVDVWPTTCPEWVVALGHYGDCIATLGNLQQILRETSGESAGVLYYGSLPGAAEFLARQAGVREVRSVIEADAVLYRRTAERACNYTVSPAAWLPGLARRAELDPCEIQLCHPRSLETAPVYRPGRLELSPEAREWAASVLPVAGEAILIQPFSTASCPLGEHWPHWRKALSWMLRRPTAPLVLCGLGSLADWLDGATYRVLDLTGKTPTMEHLLALTERCRGLVSTTNSLSMWSITQGIPGVFCCNRQIRNPAWYFRRWIEAPPNRIVDYRDGLEAFKAAVATL